MKVSIITVCFNAKLTIERTIQSVFFQDYKNIEYIIIDGGSIDGTQKLIEKYSEHVSYFSSRSDKGIYDAMNKGLDVATGDIVCFLNADDWYQTSTTISLVASEIIENNLDALIADVGFVNKNNIKKIVRRYCSKRFTPNRLAWGWMPAHPSLFLRKEVINRVGRFNASYRIAGDFEYVIRIFHDRLIKYKHLDEILVLMETGGASNHGLRARLLLNMEVLRACRENGINTNFFKIISKYPAKLLEYF